LKHYPSPSGNTLLKWSYIPQSDVGFQSKLIHANNVPNIIAIVDAKK
jgi:hypothetical protein